MNTLVSVIVPVYNAQKYLYRCVESLVKQDYCNIEIILVNDGSTDDSFEICKRYAQNEQRIIAIEKGNGGPGSARNLGINYAKGEYVCFVDSDDYVNTKYISSLISDSKGLKSVLVFQNYGEGSQSKHIITESKVINGEEIINYLFDKKIILQCGPCAKLYDINIIKKYKIFFPENIRMGEDFVFILRYLLNVETVVLSNQKEYNVVTTQGSLKQQLNPFEQELETYLLLKENIQAILHKYSILSAKHNEYIWNLAGNTFIRTTQSVFRYKKKSNFNTQINKLKILSNEDIDIMRQEYHPTNIRLRVMRFLITNNLYRIYSFVGMIDDKIKHKL